MDRSQFLKLIQYLFLSILVLCGCQSVKSTAASKTSQKDQQKIFLVRHAEKVDDGTKDPDLSQDGKARAKRLSAILSKENIELILSSNYKRTRNTGTPISEKMGLEIQLYKPMTGDVLEIIKSQTKGNILVIGHSNTIPNLVNQLIADEKYMQLTEMEYDKVFVVTQSENGYKDRMFTFDSLEKL